MPESKEARIVKGKDGKFQLENFYTPLSEAKKEIWRRWNDKALRKKVEEFLGGDVPEVLRDKPKAYLARQLNTPDKEFSRFLQLSKKLDLSPICPELLIDKFSAQNSDKYYLGKLFFHAGNGKNGGNKISTLKIIDFNNSEGKKISSLKTVWGENLVDFHHTILYTFFPEIKRGNPDFSLWFNKKKKNIKDLYKIFFSFCICHVVLLESYVVEEENEFIKNNVMPQFNWLWKKFNLKPLVVRLLPKEKENDQMWCCHPESIKKLLHVMTVV